MNIIKIIIIIILSTLYQANPQLLDELIQALESAGDTLSKHYAANIRALQEERDALQAANGVQHNQLQVASAKADECANDHIALQEQNDRVYTALSESTIRNEQLMTANNKLQQENDASNAENAQCKNDNEGLIRDKAQCNSDNEGLKAEKVQCEGDRANLIGDKAQCDSDKTGLITDNAQCQSDKTGLIADKTNCESENAGLIKDNGQCESENAGLIKDNGQCESETAGLAADKAKCEGEKASLAGDNTKCEGEKAGLAGDNTKCESEKAGLAGDKTKCEGEKAALEAAQIKECKTMTGFGSITATDMTTYNIDGEWWQPSVFFPLSYDGSTQGCIFCVGDGNGGAEGFLGNFATHQECVTAVQAQTPYANGATFGISGIATGECWAEDEMAGRVTNNDYESCIIRKNNRGVVIYIFLHLCICLIT